MVTVYPSAAAILNMKRSGKTDWYRIENRAGAPAQVHIYDEIGLYGITAGQFIQDLADIKGDVEVHLNTPGGEVFDGIAIYNALRQRSPVIIIDAIAASIGTVIAMAARPGGLLMEPTAKMMIHDGFAMAAGNAAELSKMVEQLDSASNTIAGIYALRTGMPPEAWRAAMKEETWYTAEEAVAAGLADEVLDARSGRIAALWNAGAGAGAAAVSPCDPDGDGDDDSTPEGDTDHDYWDEDGNQIQDLPGRPVPAKNAAAGDDDAQKPFPGAAPPFKKKAKSKKKKTNQQQQEPSSPAQPADELTEFLITALQEVAGSSGTRRQPGQMPDMYVPASYHRVAGETAECPSCRKFNHLDAWFCDQCGKKIAGRVDINITDGPGTPPGQRISNADVDTSAWNASRAWHNGASSSDPAKFYAGICAGKRDGDPAQQSSWALPYKYNPGDPPNAAAVRNALARIDQTQGLINKPAAQSLLEGLMKKINPDYEPSDTLAELFLASLKEA